MGDVHLKITPGYGNIIRRRRTGKTTPNVDQELCCRTVAPNKISTGISPPLLFEFKTTQNPLRRPRLVVDNLGGWVMPPLGKIAFDATAVSVVRVLQHHYNNNNNSIEVAQRAETRGRIRRERDRVRCRRLVVGEWSGGWLAG